MAAPNTYIKQSTGKGGKIMLGIGIFLSLIVIFYLSARASYYCYTNDYSAVLTAAFYSCLDIQTHPFALRFDHNTLSAFVMIAGAIGIVAWIAHEHSVLNAHYKSEESCGTAKFQTLKSIKNTFNPIYNEPHGKKEAYGPQNTIYSKHCYLTMDTGHTNLNNNAMVIGGPGSGKSFNLVRPNLMQAYGSYVVTDPAGELLATTGKFFEEEGYDVKVFNLTDMTHSHRYNPFNYLRGEEDVLTLIQCLIKNTSDAGKTGGDPFWEKAETALYQAIIFLLIRYQKKKNHTFATVSAMVRRAKLDPKTAKSQLDSVFDEIKKIDPEDICVRQYDIFKQATDKTAQSILITAAVRLAPFNIDAVANLTCEDDFDFASIGDRKSVIFILVPQGNNPYAFLVNMFYSQLFDTLYYHGANDCDGLRLKYDVRFILDEFANIGIIPDFQVKLTTMRKYGLSCMIFIQAVGQIKNLYKDDWETLMGACDTLVYLGGNELSSMEDLVKKLGVQTIRTKDTSSSKNANGSGSDSKSFKYTKRELLTIDEVRMLRKGYCIIIIKGVDPFYDEKYLPWEHENWKKLGNLKDGTRLYTFNYCNTKASSIDRLEKNRRLLQDSMRRKFKETKRPSDAPATSTRIIPNEPGVETDEATLNEKARALARSTKNVQFDHDLVTQTGGTIHQINNGKSKIITARPATGAKGNPLNRGSKGMVNLSSQNKSILSETSNVDDSAFV